MTPVFLASRHDKSNSAAIVSGACSTLLGDKLTGYILLPRDDQRRNLVNRDLR
jgi:hypothetical protein